jgi:PadR family transcriptional regulator PadR
MNVENWKSQLRKGVFDMVILNILKERPLYGLEMIEILDGVPGLAISEGTIYPLLSRLKAEGVLFAEWVESEQGRPRKYYSLSENGRRTLAELNEAWFSFSDNILKLLKGGQS